MVRLIYFNYLCQGDFAIPDVYLFIYLSVGLLAGSHRKLRVDLAEKFSLKVRLGPRFGSTWRWFDLAGGPDLHLYSRRDWWLYLLYNYWQIGHTLAEYSVVTVEHNEKKLPRHWWKFLLSKCLFNCFWILTYFQRSKLVKEITLWCFLSAG